YDGIEDADNFAFVISPDSVASEICEKELHHAIKHKKRLIPLLRRDVQPGQQVHSALASHNWIFFRDADDFEASFNALIGAVDTDLPHVRMHTRITKKASEWQQRGQDASFLLRGADLVEAESWL